MNLEWLENNSTLDKRKEQGSWNSPPLDTNFVADVASYLYLTPCVQQEMCVKKSDKDDAK